MTTIVFETEFNLWQILYIKTDNQQLPVIVCGMLYKGDNNEIMYEISRADITIQKWYSAKELSAEKDIMLTSTN